MAKWRVRAVLAVLSAVAVLSGLLGVGPQGARAVADSARLSAPLPPGKVSPAAHQDAKHSTQPRPAKGSKRAELVDGLKAQDAARRTARPTSLTDVPKALTARWKAARSPQAEAAREKAVLPGDARHRTYEKSQPKRTLDQLLDPAPAASPTAAKSGAGGAGTAPVRTVSAETASAKTYGVTYSTAGFGGTPPWYGGFGTLNTTVCNKSNFAWAKGDYELGYHLYANGDTTQSSFGFTDLPTALGVNACVNVPLVVEELAAGSYKLALDMMEGPTDEWFSTGYGIPAVVVSFTVPHSAPSTEMEEPLDNDVVENLEPRLFVTVSHDATKALDIDYSLCAEQETGESCTSSGWMALNVLPGVFRTTSTWNPPTSAMRWNTAYDWHVTIREAGTVRPQSPTAHFTTVIPPAPGAAWGVDASTIDAAGVNARDGNYTRAETDLTVPGIGLPLEISRTYNSAKTTAGLFGLGWTSFLDMRSRQEGDDFVVVSFPDGREIRFGRNPDGTYAPQYGDGDAVSVMDYTHVMLRGGTRYQFNGDGTIDEISSPDGDSLKVDYSGGVPYRVDDVRSGRSLYLTVTGGLITRVATAPAGSTASDVQSRTYRYQGNQLQQVCAPMDPSPCGTVYAYVGPGSRMSGVERANETQRAVISYDDDGLVSHVDLGDDLSTGVDNGWSYARRTDPDDGSRIVVVTDPRGNAFSYQYAVNGDLWSRWVGAGAAFDGGTRSWFYDVRGRLSGVMDENDNVTQYLWDSISGQVSDVIQMRDDSTQITTHTDYYWYTPGDPRNGLPRTVQDPDHATASYTYTADGRLSTESETGWAPPTRYTYSCDGGAAPPAAVDDADAPAGSTVPCGLLIDVTDPEGLHTRYGYNTHGDRTRTVTASGLVTDTVYDGVLGRPLTVTTDALDGAVSTSTTAYDADGRVSTVTDSPVTDPVSGTVHQKQVANSYDSGYNRLTSTVTRDLTPADQGGDPARTVDYGYDSRDRVTDVTENGVETQHVRYDGMGNVVESWSPTGGHYTFWYTDADQLSEVRLENYTDDPTIQSTPRTVPLAWYDYDDAGRLSATTDEMGATVLYDYTPDGLTKQESVLGAAEDGGDLVLHAYTYDNAGNALTDTAGTGDEARTIKTAYDAQHRPGLVEVAPDAQDRTTSYSYDFDGNVISTLLYGAGSPTEETAALIGPDGQLAQTDQWVSALEDPLVTEYRRDAEGRPLAITDPRGVTSYGILGNTDPAYTINQTYDAYGRLSSIAQPPVSVDDGTDAAQHTERPTTVYGYDTFGDLTEEKDPDGRVTRHEYDVHGRLVKTVYPSYTAPGDTAVTPSESWTYDDSGNVTSHTDLRGATTDYVYDVRDRLAHVTQPSAGDGAPRGTTTYRYDDGGHLLSVVDPTLAQTLQTFDVLGRTTSVTDVVRRAGAAAQQFTTYYAYDDFGEVTHVTPPDGLVTSYMYDKNGDMWQRWQGSDVSFFYYDIAGRLVKEVDPNQATRFWDRDPTGRVTAERYTDGTEHTLAAETYSYDKAGNVTGVTDPDGHKQTITYDALNQPTTLTGPQTTAADGAVQPPAVTRFGYDELGDPTRVTDADDHATTTTYNSLGLAESVVLPATSTQSSPADRTTTTAYDAAGDPVRQTAPGGVVRTSHYDDLGRPTAVAATGGDGDVQRGYGYDLDGRITSAANEGQQAQSFTYDDRGLLISSQGPAGSSSYTYDGDGRTLTQEDPAGSVSYTWTDQGHGPMSRTDSVTGTTTSYAYDMRELPAGEVTQNSAGDTVQTRTFDFDQLDRLTKDTSTGTQNLSQSYSWDPAGNLASATTDGSATDPHTQTYTYDEAERLTRTQDTTTGEGTDYTWDPAGNRTRTTNWTAGPDGQPAKQTSTTSASYDERERVTEADSADGSSTAYSYTPRGTLASTATTPAGGGTPVSRATGFDALDEMTADGQNTYQYDALGRLLGSSDAGGGTGRQFGYGGFSQEPATDGSYAYARDPDGTAFASVPTTTDGTPSLLIDNIHGDQVAQRDADGGAITAGRSYGPFGAVTQTTGDPSNLGFQGSWTDPDSGRVDAEARWYSPDSGTFTAPDSADVPVADATSVNPYAYGSANPATYSDPTGHFSINPAGLLSDLSSAVKNAGRVSLNAAETAGSAIAESGGGQLVDQLAERLGTEAAEEAAARVGLHFVPGLGEVMIGIDVATLVYYIVNADGSTSPVNVPGSTQLSQPATTTPPMSQGPARQAVTQPQPPAPPAVHLTGTSSSSSTKAWSTQSSWWDDTNRYDRTDDYTYTTYYTWSYFSDGSSNSKITGTSWKDFYRTVVTPLIDLDHPAADLGTLPTAVGEGVDTPPSSTTPTGSCTSGGSLSDCAPTQRGAPLPPDALIGGNPCGEQPGRAVGLANGLLCTGDGNFMHPGTGTVYCGPDGGSGACTPMPAGFSGTADSGAACGKDSFSADTPVLLANGTHEPIADIHPGDQVLSTDPATGRTTAETVTATLVHRDSDLVDLSVQADGRTATLHTTANHPFWTPATHTWTPAAALHAGTSLTTTPAHHATVQSPHPAPGTATRYNLTVSDVHTYYVLAGGVPILVHNTCGNGVYEQGGSVRYHPLDADGRATGVSASLSKGMLDTGTAANGAIEPSGWGGNGTLYNEARGHLLADRLGGSGDLEENLVTLTQDPTNSPIMRDEVEGLVYDAVNLGETVQYNVRAIYGEDGDVPPIGLEIEAFGNQGFYLKRYLENPAGMFGMDG